MEAIWQHLLTMDGWVPAVCDLVALTAVVATVGLWRTREPKPASMVPAQDPAVHAPFQAEIALASKRDAESEPTPRADVKRALAAIGHWEEKHRSGRGVVELARFVKTQRSSRGVTSR